MKIYVNHERIKLNYIQKIVLQLLHCFILLSGLFPVGTQIIVCIEAMTPYGKEKEIITILSNNDCLSYEIQDFTNINSRTI